MIDDADSLAEPAIELAATWVTNAKGEGTRADRVAMQRLRGVLADESGVDFVMAFVDRVARPSDNRVAATQLAALVNNQKLPEFLNVADRNLLRAGARLAPVLPDVVMPLARSRMRAIVGHLVAPAEARSLAKHLTRQRTDGYALNVNLLGEAVLGEREAAARFDELVALMDQPDVDYVSVKISAVASQLNHWDYAASLHRVTERVSELLDRAAAASTSRSGSTFVNFDMEEYHDLELTLEAFIDALSVPERHNFEAGIVLQAYLPDSFGALQQLVEWANLRHQNGGGAIKIRLVKGANLAMERVDAVMHGWEQAPYGTKVESDANFKRCLDWVLTENRMKGVRIGLASHNLFDIAWTRLLAEARGVLSSVQFEMLQGMAPAMATVVNNSTENDLLLYTPAVDVADFDVAISYLFRRLEENAANDNFMRALLDLSADSASFATEADRFKESLARRKTVPSDPRRNQNRTLSPTRSPDSTPFFNDPETDPTSPANRPWIAEILASEQVECQTPMTLTEAEVDQALALAKQGASGWSSKSPAERSAVLLEAAHQLDLRRGLLISTMMHEAHKTLPQGDVEVCEAIDFARWYADSALELGTNDLADFSPFGVVAVVPPWNFPVAITAGGVLASLAAGNSVILKPAPEVPRCAEVIAEALWAAGVPPDVLQFVRTPDDAVGKRLVCGADAVVLTGASQTADLFHSWNPGMRLFAETSGKNALIVTPNADLDLAARDLVQSAFGHSGQKCSAASIAILVGDVGEDERFRRQIVDAVESLTIGSATDLGTDIAPLVGGPNERIVQAVEEGPVGNQRWLVEPRLVPRGFCTPGILDNVGRDSWFHNTECFGPLLGLINVADLDEAIEVANSSDFGLTGGIHSLDPAEVDRWTQEIEVGNGYVNRAITGAIVQRQPFGGWKRSSVGPGAKAGGPNYVMGLGTWASHDSPPNDSPPNDYAAQWAEHFSVDHDPAGLFCEANIFRYRPLSHIVLRITEGATDLDIERVRQAVAICGVALTESSFSVETDEDFAERVPELARNGLTRVRHVGDKGAPLVVRTAALASGVHVSDSAVTPSGRVELQHYVREQSMSVTLHRFGNLVGATASI